MMEKDQERVHKKVDNTFYGVLVAAVVQMLQQKKGDEELIHFK